MPGLKKSHDFRNLPPARSRRRAHHQLRHGNSLSRSTTPLAQFLAAQQSHRIAELALSAKDLAILENYATFCQALGGSTASTGATIP